MIWQIFEQTCYFSQWRHLGTLWWKISICHYLMVWCCLSERRLLFFDLCLFVFASLFWLPLHFLLSPCPASLLLPRSLRSRTIPPPSSESPHNTLLHFSHLSLRRGVDCHRDSCQLHSCCGKRWSERKKTNSCGVTSAVISGKNLSD